MACVGEGTTTFVGGQRQWTRAINTSFTINITLLFLLCICFFPADGEEKDCYRPFPLPGLSDRDARAVTIILLIICPTLVLLMLDICICRCLYTRHMKKTGDPRHVTFTAPGIPDTQVQTAEDAQGGPLIVTVPRVVTDKDDSDSFTNLTNQTSSMVDSSTYESSQ